MAAMMSSWEEGRDRLKKLRDEQQRRSEEVLELWDDFSTDFCYKLGDEVWMVYEQVCIAACDCGQIQLAEMCIDALQAQFPESYRVQKLLGMKFEAQEKFDIALEIYQEIKEAEPTNALIWKRIIALAKAQHNPQGAIKELNDYLKHFMSDYEAWLELSDLYLAEQDFGRAAFCMEELILSSPHNHLFHQRYAEIKYTQGGADSMEIARSYFSQACRLNPTNMRALFGLFLSANNIAARGNNKQKKENLKYAAWAASQIHSLYKVKNGNGIDSQGLAIDGLLESLSIAS